MEGNEIHMKLITKITSPKIMEDDFMIKSIEIQNRIGTGNFGSVFVGKMGLTPVAVKKLNTVDSKTLLEEAKILYLLRSPYIVQFLGLYKKGEEWNLVTEYLPKGSLENFLLKKTRPLDMLMNMLITGAQGMEYLASKKIIHRGK